MGSHLFCLLLASDFKWLIVEPFDQRIVLPLPRILVRLSVDEIFESRVAADPVLAACLSTDRTVDFSHLD